VNATWITILCTVLAAAIGIGVWEVAVTEPVRLQAADRGAKLNLVGTYLGALRDDLNQLAEVQSSVPGIVIFATDITQDPFVVAIKRLAMKLDVAAPTAVVDLTAKVTGATQ
jgi:hypothetical protein